MRLHKNVLQQLDRLGATVSKSDRRDARAILIHDVQWPSGPFDSSIEGFVARNPVYEDLPEDEVAMDVPRILGLEFLPAESPGFWEGWQDDFTGVDHDKHSPFATDDAYFYFLADHFRQPTDPLVFKVDHEETGEPPNDWRNLTVSDFLDCLEPRSSA